jgi:hypothetical protein
MISLSANTAVANPAALWDKGHLDLLRISSELLKVSRRQSGSYAYAVLDEG